MYAHNLYYMMVTSIDLPMIIPNLNKDWVRAPVILGRF